MSEEVIHRRNQDLESGIFLAYHVAKVASHSPWALRVIHDLHLANTPYCTRRTDRKLNTIDGCLADRWSMESWEGAGLGRIDVSHMLISVASDHPKFSSIRKLEWCLPPQRVEDVWFSSRLVSCQKGTCSKHLHHSGSSRKYLN